MKLYELNEHLQNIELELERYADDNDGQIHPALEKMLDGLQGTKQEKLEACYKYFKSIKREAEAVAAEKRFISARLEALTKKQDAFKSYIESCLEPGEKWNGTVGTIYWTTRESVVETDIEQVPDRYVKKELAGKKELMTDLKNGAKIPGVEIQVNTSLVIR